MSVHLITTRRLKLVPMTAEFYQASLAGDRARAELILGLGVPTDWFAQRSLIERRLSQLQADSALLPWLARAIVLRDQPRMVGYIGFHSAPGNEWLRDFAPGGAEFGYTIYPSFQRNGYATEAAEALMAWASAEHRVKYFVLTISPYNIPSRRIAARFGFQCIGSHMDEEDGVEDIFVLSVHT